MYTIDWGLTEEDWVASDIASGENPPVVLQLNDMSRTLGFAPRYTTKRDVRFSKMHWLPSPTGSIGPLLVPLSSLNARMHPMLAAPGMHLSASRPPGPALLSHTSNTREGKNFLPGPHAPVCT